MARPKKPIDEEQLGKLAAMHCSIEEIAAWFNVSRDTIEKRYSAFIAQKRAAGKARLRGWMWEAASKGNPAMQIWMSKNLLGMSDKVESETKTVQKVEVTYVAEWGGSAPDDQTP